MIPLLRKNTNLTKLDDETLEFHHFLLHQWYKAKLKSNKPEGWTLIDIEKKHKEINKELEKRYSKPLPNTDKLDLTIKD